MSDYDCYCESDGPSVFSKTTHTARKEHRCSECGRAIQPGEVYEKHWGVWGGDAQSYKHCQRCIALIKHVEAHAKCVCWTYCGALDEAWQVACEYKYECPAFFAEVDAMIAACRAAPAVTKTPNNQLSVSEEKP